MTKQSYDKATELSLNLSLPVISEAPISEFDFQNAIGFEHYLPEDMLTYITAVDVDGLRKLYYVLDGETVVYS